MNFLDSYPTEFYISDIGYLVFKQECFECGHQTMFLITPEQTKILANLLPDMMKQQTERWTGLQKDLTNDSQ
jgi:hypothetical protein